MTDAGAGQAAPGAPTTPGVDAGSVGSASPPSTAGNAGRSIGSAVAAAKYPALRMGWMMAQVRGNLRKLPKVGAETPNSDPALPLDAANERTAAEQAVEAVKVLANVATAAGLDFDIAALTDQPLLRLSGSATTT